MLALKTLATPPHGHAFQLLFCRSRIRSTRKNRRKGCNPRRTILANRGWDKDEVRDILVPMLLCCRARFFTHGQRAIELATIYATLAVGNVVPIDKPLPSTIGVPNLCVALVSSDTVLINCIEGSNRDRSIFPRVYCGRQCLSKPVV